MSPITDNFVDESFADQGIDSAIQNHSAALSELILSLRTKVNSYCAEFNEAATKYELANNLGDKMKRALDPGKHRGEKMMISASAYRNELEATKNFRSVLKKGHSLLLEMRETLTGQHINTKFIISVEGGKTYMVNESDIAAETVLSRFGSTTVSNPLSLAYEIDANIEPTLQSLVETEKAQMIEGTNIWNEIDKCKAAYLEKLSKQNNRKYEKRWFDSKDAEIYTLYSGYPPGGGEDIELLTADHYESLRKSMGGQGGYASAFYKIGDIGLTQVKYFRIKKDSKTVAVNFARFSLLRDRFRQLSDILAGSDYQQIGTALRDFFTETHDISENITRKMNEEARNVINALFGLS